MSYCLECGETYVDGALFCAECGATLFGKADPEQTLPVPDKKVSESLGPFVPQDYRLRLGTKADRIVFVIPSSGRKLEALLARSISLGRTDVRQGIWPEVDLTPDDGAEKGVSRRHALIRSSDDGVILVDLHSTNGTQVNDRRLHPGRPYLLKNGDMVRLGNLMVRVVLES